MTLAILMMIMLKGTGSMWVINEYFRGSYIRQFGPWCYEAKDRAEEKLKDLQANAGPGEEYELVEANLHTTNPNQLYR